MRPLDNEVNADVVRSEDKSRVLDRLMMGQLYVEDDIYYICILSSQLSLSSLAPYYLSATLLQALENCSEARPLDFYTPSAGT